MDIGFQFKIIRPALLQHENVSILIFFFLSLPPLTVPCRAQSGGLRSLLEVPSLPDGGRSLYARQQHGGWWLMGKMTTLSSCLASEALWLNLDSLSCPPSRRRTPQTLTLGLLPRRRPWSSSLATAWRNCCRASKTCTSFTSTPPSTPSSLFGRSTKTRSELTVLVELNCTWLVSLSWGINPLVSHCRYQEVSLIEAPAQLSLNWRRLLVFVEL